MARLSSDEWAEMRAEWEASPRQGLTWLIKAGGGRWEITEEAVRRKRAADSWQKRGDPVVLARAARNAADDLEARRVAARAEGSPLGTETDALGSEPKVASPPKVGAANQSESPEPEDPQVAIRAQTLDTQRREWKATRGLVWSLLDSIKPVNGEPAPLADRLKVARVVPRALQIIQEGERRVWGLDADLIDYDALTDEQLAQVARGKMPR